MKSAAACAAVLAVLFFLSGCGETIAGASKDISRIGKGFKTIFVSDDKAEE